MSKWRTQLQLVLLVIECCLLSIYAHHCSLNVEHQLNVTTNVQTLDILRTQEDGYATDITCEWLLKAPSADHAIRLSITKLDTECSWDRLYLYDGKSFQDKLLGVYSGSMLPRNVYATSGFMLIYFFSDYSGTFTGFQLEYSLTNSDTLEVIGEIDRCGTNAECNTQFGLNQCNAVTKKCDCQGNYMGLFCELEMFQSRLYSHGWNLLSVNTKAMSRTGHAIAAFSDTLYLFGGYDFTTSHNDLYTSSDMYTFHLVTLPALSSQMAGTRIRW
ncbi:hypothetical protein EB796_019817 [Bugula neritina]|uniref:CUB domain-containing protein n=1 Tax=Bugula neritina TaxID=10212 RepID=A0A7J7J770_BUGNE|nr:hypothetical protein EB796_019817 [Bugula neritina]